MSTKSSSQFSFEDIENKLGSKSFYTLIFITILMNLFFIQALRAFIPGIYGSLAHVVFGEDIIMNSLILITFSFFFLPAFTDLICKKFGKKNIMIKSIYIIVILRTLLAFHLPSKLQTICSALIVPFYGFYMSILLTLWIEDKDKIVTENKVIIIVFSILFSFLLDYFIRTIGNTQDISLTAPGLKGDWRITQYYWLIIQVPLAIFCIYYAKKYFPTFSSQSRKMSLNIENEEKQNTISTVYSLTFAGIGVFFFLLFCLFLYPNAIAQYTMTNYHFNNILNIISLMIAISIILFVNKNLITNIKTLSILNIFMVIILIVFLFFGKTLTYIASILISILLIILYLNFFVLFIKLADVNFKWVRLKSISNAITIALLFMLIFDILHTLTTDWAGTSAIFKGLGPLIMILAGIILSISTITSIVIKSKKELLKDEIAK